jgi:hypothetical protein
MPERKRRLLALFLGYFLLQSTEQPLLNVGGHGLCLHPLKDLQRPPSCVTNHPAVWTFVDVAFDLTAEAGINRLVEKITQLL